MIRDHILQSLISHPKLYDHQADALIILLKLAGATFAAYADPSVVDRCFELLKHHKFYNHYRVRYNNFKNSENLRLSNDYDLTKRESVQVCVLHPEKGTY